MPSRRTMVQRALGAAPKSGQAHTTRAALDRTAKARTKRITCGALVADLLSRANGTRRGGGEWPPRRGVSLLRGGGGRRLRRGLIGGVFVVAEALGRLLGRGQLVRIRLR